MAIEILKRYGSAMSKLEQSSNESARVNASRERDKVADYLRDIEARLGRDIAERVKTSILACGKSTGWLRDVERLRVKR